MRILKRPSGGRGEYEIAGSFNEIRPQDLEGKELVLQLDPYSAEFPTGIHMQLQGGKCRLRIRKKGVIHIHRQLETILLLPKSIRDETKLPGGRPTIFQNRYVLRGAEIQELRIDDEKARITIGTLECENGYAEADEIDVADRLSTLGKIHNYRHHLSRELMELLEEHRRNVEIGKAIKVNAERLVGQISDVVDAQAIDFNIDYLSGADCVPVLAEMLGIQPVQEPEALDEIDPSDSALRRREAKKWRRWVSARGAEAARFRRSVREAYDFRCVICGVRYPTAEGFNTPGVDAAHILPWAKYDLDEVSNGLCLCKLHHWAFDQCLIVILPSNEGEYNIVVSEAAIEAFGRDSDLVQMLMQFEGQIPTDLLPAKRHCWPNPGYLKEFLAMIGEEIILRVESSSQ